MNFELLNLEKALFNDCGNGVHNWTDHATLLIDEPEKILQAIQIVTETFQPFAAKIESLSLYEFFPARLISRYKLST